MIVLNLNEDELIKMVRSGEDLTSGGFSGSLFIFKEYLIKIDKNLFRTIKNSSNEVEIYKRIFSYCRYEKLADENQIAYLLSKQEKVKLTEFDLGVVKVNGVVCGVILPNHLDYQNLSDFKVDSNQQIPLLLKLLNNLLKALKELEDNGISQIDLINMINKKMNILYKDEDIKLCDLEGVYLKYGENAPFNLMYQEFIKILEYFLLQITKFNPKAVFLLKTIKEKEVISYEDALKIFNAYVNFLNEEILMPSYEEPDITSSK